MSLPGPLSVSSVNAPITQDLGLRPFQRVTAQILAVTGTTAILSVDGFPIVAQLTSSDQAAALLNQQTAHFIVTRLTDQTITLKFIKPDQPQAAATAALTNAPELAMRLLEQNQLPVTANMLGLARAVLKQYLPVTPELLNELVGALSDLGTWGPAQAELAATLKAAGLPVTAQSLKLASNQAVQTGESLSNLISQLNNLSGKGLPTELLTQINANLQSLNESVLQAGGDSSQLAKQLKTAVEMLGRSLESVLLEQSNNPDPSKSEKGLLALAQLQHSLEMSGEKKTAQTIEKFLGDLRQNQFLNVRSEPQPGSAAWSEIGLMLQPGLQKTQEDFSSVRLRIAREPRPNSGKIDPAYTRLILQVEIKPGEMVEVDLSLVGKQIRTAMTAPDPAWCAQAEQELPSLEDALQNLGFNLKDVQIGVGEPRAFDRLSVGTGRAALRAVDIEV